MKNISIGNICIIRNGYAFKSNAFKETGIPIVRIGEIKKNGKIDITNSPLVEYDEKYKSFILKNGDILIAMSGATTGKIGLYDSETVAYQNQRVGCFIPDKLKLNNIYLFHFLKSISHFITKSAYGGGQPNISSKEISKFKIPLPSLTDQKRIAKVLSDAETLISQRKESIALLDELLKSTFLDMFGDPVLNEKGWEKKALKDITTKIGSGSTPRGGKEAYKKEGISLIRSLNIHDNRFKYKDLAFIDEEQAYKLRNVIVEENDILFNITGASVCRCTIVPQKVLPARVNQHVAIIRIKPDEINYLYLSFLLTSKNFKKFLIKTATMGGATREALTKEQLENIKILIAPIAQQHKFAKIVKQTELIKKHYEKSLHELENLYGSISQLAFTGELDLSGVDVVEEELSDDSGDSEIVLEKEKLDEKLIDKEELYKLEEATERKKNKLNWEDISISKIAQLIKDKYKGYHFNIEMLFRFFNEEELIYPFYFSSKELKNNPQLYNKDDIKSFVFSSLPNINGESKNPHFKLKQEFYNSEEENFVLKLTKEDYELLKEKSNRSGIYFSIIG